MPFQLHKMYIDITYRNVHNSCKRNKEPDWIRQDSRIMNVSIDWRSKKQIKMMWVLRLLIDLLKHIFNAGFGLSPNVPLTCKDFCNWKHIIIVISWNGTVLDSNIRPLALMCRAGRLLPAAQFAVLNYFFTPWVWSKMWLVQCQVRFTQVCGCDRKSWNNLACSASLTPHCCMETLCSLRVKVTVVSFFFTCVTDCFCFCFLGFFCIF